MVVCCCYYRRSLLTVDNIESTITYAKMINNQIRRSRRTRHSPNPPPTHLPPQFVPYFPRLEPCFAIRNKYGGKSDTKRNRSIRYRARGKSKTIIDNTGKHYTAHGIREIAIAIVSLHKYSSSHGPTESDRTTSVGSASKL